MSDPVLQRFYQALAARDWMGAGACYHEEARFGDPVFPALTAVEVRAMWRMLLTSGTDLRVTFTVLEADADRGRAQWEARYTFSRTGRSVHNVIRSEFRFKEGLILHQHDQFDLWRWSRQALGLSGWLLGWGPIVRNKVRKMAAASLRKAMG